MVTMKTPIKEKGPERMFRALWQGDGGCAKP
jgi:hypothetical protein